MTSFDHNGNIVLFDRRWEFFIAIRVTVGSVLHGGLSGMLYPATTAATGILCVRERFALVYEIDAGVASRWWLCYLHASSQKAQKLQRSHPDLALAGQLVG